MKTDHDKIEDLLNQALALEPKQRAAFLVGACGQDNVLREKVESLLKAYNEADGFLPESPRNVSISEGPGDRIGRYKLLEKIGEGGMGVVYMAEQEEPVRRKVALKIIKLGMDTRQVVARFEAERQALAMMDHPNIARVLDGGATDSTFAEQEGRARRSVRAELGDHEGGAQGTDAPYPEGSSALAPRPSSLVPHYGRPYFVMELVQGVPITEFCKKNKLSIEERIKLLIPVCQAIHSAHQKGIIHRDIKPSNVLVTLHDGVPVPKVIDFGVAKAINQKLTERTLFTNFGTMIGTPAYMSPEQAEMSGLDIDTRSDIYSLGVLLYELLTGTTPFPENRLRSVAFAEMQRIIMQEEPERPSKVVKRLSDLKAESEARSRQSLNSQLQSLSSDLDWIVMKCLEKDRNRRYETANSLARDIKRHLDREPILARPPSSLYRFQRLVLRNKVAFAAAAVVILALVGGMAMATVGLIRERRARADEQTHRKRAELASEETRRRAYAAEINLAFQALAENNLGRALELLNRQRPKPGEEDLRGFEWRHLWQLCQPDETVTFRDQGAQCAAFSPDGRWLAYGAEKIIIRALPSQAVVTNFPDAADTLAFSPTGKLLASGHGSYVKLWSAESWQEERSLTNAHAPAVFSPDGQWLVTGFGDGYRDGDWLPTGTNSGYLVWRTETWEPMGFCPSRLSWPEQSFQSVAFSPDGKLLVTAGHPGGREVGQFQVWDLPALTVRTNFVFFPFKLASAAFTPDGRRLLTGGWFGELLVWEVATGRVVESLKGHTGRISAIAYARDGRTFATVSSDRTIIVWDAATRQVLVQLRGHLEELRSVAMSPDGRTLASGSLDHTTKLWDATTRHEKRNLQGLALIAGFSADSRVVVIHGQGGLSLWRLSDDAMTTIPLDPFTFRGLDTWLDVRGFEPYALFAQTNGTVEFWNLRTMSRLTSWRVSETRVMTAALSPDARFLAASDVDGDMKLWDVTTQREVRRFAPWGRRLKRVAFSADGRLVAAEHHARVCLWNVDDGRVLRELDTRGEGVRSLEFSPDGNLLAIGCQNNTAQLWDIPSGKQRATLRGHLQEVIGVAFSPDGKTLATGGDDRKVKLWNIATHQEVATLGPLDGGCRSLRFSPDGRSLAVGHYRDPKSYLWLWQAPSFEEIAAAESKKKPETN